LKSTSKRQKKADDESKNSYLAKLIGDDDKKVKESVEKSANQS